MTVAEIKELDRDFLVPREVAQVLGCDPYTINVYAKQCPERLGFPTLMIGNRVKIPREGFLRFMVGDLHRSDA